MIIPFFSLSFPTGKVRGELEWILRGQMRREREKRGKGMRKGEERRGAECREELDGLSSRERELQPGRLPGSKGILHTFSHSPEVGEGGS